MTAAATQTRDLAWLKRNIPDGARAVAVDVTSAYSVLGLMGPRSREVLSRLTDADLSNDMFPFATSREIDLGYARVRASRITYVGELGWELYVPTEFVQGVFDAVREEGAAAGMRLAGYHAMNSLRMEKGYTIGLMSSIPQLSGSGGKLAAIPGMVPSPARMPTGCRFHPRCPFSTAQCETEAPPLRNVGERHQVACWLAPIEDLSGNG